MHIQSTGGFPFWNLEQTPTFTRALFKNLKIILMLYKVFTTIKKSPQNLIIKLKLKPNDDKIFH